MVVVKGFRKINLDQWEFVDEAYIAGQNLLPKHIRRWRPSKNHMVITSYWQTDHVFVMESSKHVRFWWKTRWCIDTYDAENAPGVLNTTKLRNMYTLKASPRSCKFIVMPTWVSDSAGRGNQECSLLLNLDTMASKSDWSYKLTLKKGIYIYLGVGLWDLVWYQHFGLVLHMEIWNVDLRDIWQLGLPLCSLIDFYSRIILYDRLVTEVTC
jgi:hypothetical protein